MTDATTTVFYLAVPLIILAALPFGWLRSRKVFLIVGIPFFLIVAALIFAGLFASGMAAGHGGGDSGGWDGFGPLILWAAFGGMLLMGGVLIRRKDKGTDASNVAETRLPTLREVQSDQLNQIAQQGGADEPFIAPQLDPSGHDNPNPTSKPRPH